MKKLIGKTVVVRVLGRVNGSGINIFDMAYQGTLTEIENTMICIKNYSIVAHLWPAEMLENGKDKTIWLNTASLDFISLKEYTA